MTRLAHAQRGERAFERLYRRHLGDVYRYVLLMLRDPHAAEEVTRAAFQEAYRVHEHGDRRPSEHAWLLGLAHAACRRSAQAGDLEDDAPLPAVHEGHEAERAVSRYVDGHLQRSERRVLRRHLRECGDCTGLVRSHRVQRPAWEALAAVPVPASLRAAPYSQG